MSDGCVTNTCVTNTVTWPQPSEPPPAFVLHGQALAAVAGDKGLKQLAGDAFRSFVRAYATHPAALRDVFHVRRLHLGHVAHSFGLKSVSPTSPLTAEAAA